MKRTLKLSTFILSVILFITAFPGSIFADTYPPGGVVASPGDILVTNNTSSYGLTGHAGIVNSDLTVSTIDGPGLHPTTHSLQTWFNSNPNTVVIRYIGDDYKNINAKAGKWAKDYVIQHPNASYKIVAINSDLENVYCSKIPWLAFWSYGVNFGDLYPWSSDIFEPYRYIGMAQNHQYGLAIAVVYGKWSNLPLKAATVNGNGDQNNIILEAPHANIPEEYLENNTVDSNDDKTNISVENN